MIRDSEHHDERYEDQPVTETFEYWLRQVELDWLYEPNFQRRGQYYMNSLHHLRPEIYNDVSESPHDPFYNDAILPRFLEYVASVW